jgi:hypothetical protein
MTLRNALRQDLAPEAASSNRLYSREQCEQFQMMRFGVSCATCERSDEEYPWHRQDEVATALRAEELITSNAARRRRWTG